MIRLLKASLLEVTDIRKNTPLHLACLGGNKDIVQLLIESGVVLNQVNMKGEAPIHIAAQHGYISIVKSLLASDVNIECQSENDKCTPLHHAAKYNQDKMIRFLYGKWYVSLITFKRMNATHVHLILVFCIHLHSANIHAEDCNLCTPVLVAAGCKHSTTHAFDCLMGYMELENAKQNPIIQVLKVQSNQEKILRVRNKVIVSIKRTFALQYSNVYTCILPLQFLVNDKTWGQKLRDCTVENGNTPLHVAAKQGNCLAVKVLLEERFNARAKNMQHRSPMHLAAEEDQHM